MATMTDIRTCRCGAKIDFDDTIGLINHTTSPEHEAAIAALPPDAMQVLRNALTGLRVKGRTLDGWLVEHRLTDKRLEPLESMGYRLTPSGPKHTVVALPREDR